MANIEIIQGDCLEIMKTFNDNQFDLVLTDPPYGLDKKLSQGAGKHTNAKFRTSYEGKSWDKLIEWSVFEEMFGVSKEQIIFGANYYSMPATRGIICWDKKQYMPTFSRWEYAWSSFQKPARMYEVLNGQDTRVHPTQKPIKLFVEILKDYTSEGDTVLDPFLGSGTTAVACERMGRNCVGIEISEEYCEIARKRVQEEKDKMGLFNGKD